VSAFGDDLLPMQQTRFHRWTKCGIGQAISFRFEGAGAMVVANYLSNEQAAE
jgi:hypothetical protein